MGRLQPQSCVCHHKAVWLQPEWCLSFLVLREDCVVPQWLEDGGAGVTEWLCPWAPFHEGATTAIYYSMVTQGRGKGEGAVTWGELVLGLQLITVVHNPDSLPRSRPDSSWLRAASSAEAGHHFHQMLGLVVG